MTPPLRLGDPLWLDRRARPARASFPDLSRDLDADVVVIGGGITGSMAAWRFAEAGLDVALVEAQRIGGGSTAASTALLMQEPDEDFVALARRYGNRRTQRIWQLSKAATHDLVATLRRLRIRCGLVGSDSVYYALTNGDAVSLRREHMRRRAAGIRGAWLDRGALQRVTGIDGAGAIRMRGDGQVDPFRACVGFANAARRLGARFFERSPVIDVRPDPHGVTVITRRGTVRASRLIVATGYATPYFEPLAARFRMLHTYVIGTRRLTPRQRRRLSLRHVMLWDAGRPYHYARWTNDGRLLLGGGDRRQVTGRARARAAREGVQDVYDFFTRLYPALRDVEIEYAWEGLFATTPDGLPYIGPHSHYPRHLFALGYGGNGMTLGYLAARFLLEQHLGQRSADHGLLAFGRIR